MRSVRYAKALQRLYCMPKVVDECVTVARLQASFYLLVGTLIIGPLGRELKRL